MIELVALVYTEWWKPLLTPVCARRGEVMNRAWSGHDSARASDAHGGVESWPAMVFCGFPSVLTQEICVGLSPSPLA